MTLEYAIKNFDGNFPNSLPYEFKLMNISRLDKRVFDNIYSEYCGCPRESFDGYDISVPGETVLLIAFPFDDLYEKYLTAQADLLNGDIKRYLNSATVFNSRYDEFGNAYNRTHRYKNTVKVGDYL